MANSAGAAVSHALSAQELDRFQRDGFIGPFDVYEPGEMESALRAMRPKLIDSRQGVYHQGDALSGTTNLASYDRHLDVDFLARHITRAEIVDRVTSVIGADALCWRTEFFPKYPGDEGTDWHQADNFANVGKHPQIVWPEDAGFGGALTVWTAFTDATVENGCLQFIPGSHRTMNYDENKVIEYDADLINQNVKNGVRRGFYGYDYRQLQKDPNWSPDESKAKSMVMRQGQAIMFWSTLMHASHPHSGLTDQMRLGFTARYVPTAVRVYPYQDTLAEYGVEVGLDKWGCVLVSGEDRFGHNRFTDRTVNGLPFGMR
ncbi:chlorinating enzyme [Streptomyces lavendulae]|uniref:chlorinating enzyme n=1 Tax=Streptomyces lavendulae TaxID=1914 RepID=UPI0033F8E763